MNRISWALPTQTSFKKLNFIDEENAIKTPPNKMTYLSILFKTTIPFEF